MSLPKWIKKQKDGTFQVDPDGFYPYLLGEFEAHDEIPYDGTVDAYWLEVAFQCMKMEVQIAVRTAGVDPRPEKGLLIHVTTTTIDADGGTHKDRWGQKNYAPGLFEGYEKTYGPAAWKAVARDARGYYKTLRGVIPQ